ncbi:hypothetical protein Pfo_011333, partial [Paulownia fortunei]
MTKYSIFYNHKYFSKHLSTLRKKKKNQCLLLFRLCLGRYGAGSLKSYQGASRHSTRSPVCSSAISAVTSAFAFPRASTATKASALATTTGRPRKVDQNAL